ncbi:tetratricopeptide repeat protein [Alphaproteobacteria bacterium]|nr:tetratricopeptide repeat protein [Alphaproteobacteria bacterium]
MSESIQGLRDIVSAQQEKISILEDNLKKLIGSIEQQSNVSNNNKFIKLFENKLNNLSNKINLLESNIKNITDLSYNLDFALKRIERHLELRSISNNNEETKNSKPNYQSQNIENIKKKSLDGKTEGVLGFVKEPSTKNIQNKNKVIETEVVKKKTKLESPKGSAEDNYDYALNLARQLDFENAEKAFKDFLINHKKSKLQADAQYWLGRVYFAQKKYEEAAIAMAEFNSVFPNDARFQETTLLIAEAAVNFAPKDQLCDILSQSLEFMVNPSDKFVKRLNFLKNEKQCPAE